jgi:hypothetical protein
MSNNETQYYLAVIVMAAAAIGALAFALGLLVVL